MRNEVKLANPNYDSSKIEEFKNVWVFCEQRQGQMMSTSYELISEGRKLADELGVKLCGLLVGDNVGDLAESIGGYGADEVIVCDHPLLKNYTTDAYSKVICDVISEMKPEAFLIGATNIGRDLGPRCAARLHTGLCADCTHLDVDMPIYKDFLRGASTLPEAKIDGMATAKVMGKDHDVSRDLKMTRPAFGGNLMATIICPRFRPSMATVRPGVMKKAAYDEAKAKAAAIWSVVANAEARVHGTTPDHVHFHEVGRMANIIAVGLIADFMTTIDPAMIVASPLPMTDGTVNCAHGVVPYPAPALYAMLYGVAVRPWSGEGEPVTPTGLAVLQGLGARFGGWPEMVVTDHVTVFTPKIFEGVANGTLMAFGQPVPAAE